MITIHPEFDTATKTWFWHDAEAPTIRELKRLIGDVRVADYYPNGMGTVISTRIIENEQRKFRTTPPTVTNLIGTKFRSNPEKRTVDPAPALERPSKKMDGRAKNGRTPGFEKQKRHNHEKILDLWVANVPAGDIARICGNGLTREVVAATITTIRKRHGDPRAIRRGRWPKSNPPMPI